ncbi:GIY-YIG nuclease family protein [Pedobacter alluvionis]|uniref:GIY-YIG nuclease family protein n=2 Tax=Pedobacter alluvionis TaxID=475253 RepID=A0ABY2HK99_9SPHI|nr:GIY-YIG nuclease family protein [Pedobacter alluvionis]TFB29464.1 GIY-YIG nuclease family protein [Pedobacter alluvionis]
MANSFNTVFYTGVTSDLQGRVWQHKNNKFPKSFTSRYKCYKLVDYSFFSEIEEAIYEEKRIKGGRRQQKIDSVVSKNPNWIDLYEGLVS